MKKKAKEQGKKCSLSVHWSNLTEILRSFSFFSKSYVVCDIGDFQKSKKCIFFFEFFKMKKVQWALNGYLLNSSIF